MFNSFMERARDTFDNVTHGQNPFGGGGSRQNQNQSQQQQRQRGRTPTGTAGTGGADFFGGSMPSFPFPHSHFHFGPGSASTAGPPPPEPRQKTPPASTKAIRMLPTIRVAPEDLIDPNNRECCVCLECNQLDDRVVRLPCAHIFHASCIVDWLANHSCTCPVCRYELPTDDPQYEVGRIERMKTRKPRYALHELKRLSVQDLLALKNRNRNLSTSSSNNSIAGLEKSELIQWLIDNDRVDVIPAPDPVRHELEKLQQMRIKDLRSTMEEAGVFFRKEDVVEKSDMLKIFLNSGRLELIVTESTEEEDSYCRTSSLSNTAATSTERSRSIDESKPSAVASMTSSKIPTEPNNDSKLPATTTTTTRKSSKTLENSIQIETVTEDDSDDEDNHDSTNRKRLKRPSDTSPEFTHQVVMFPGLDDYDSSSDRHSNETENVSDTIDRDNGPPAAAAAAAAAGNETIADAETPENQEADTGMDIDDLGSNNDGDHVAGSSDSDGGTRRSTFEHYTVAQLQNLAEDAGVDISHVLERNDVVFRLESIGLVGNRDDPDAMLSIKFDPWSISQLRAVASVADIDVSNCSGREEIIHNILFEINYVRPALRDLVRAIPPFFDYTISDLRGVARDLNVDISGCLEKDEIIYRLISRGFNRRT